MTSTGAHAAPGPAPQPVPRVAIVDDSRLFTEGLSLLLTSAGWEVAFTATTGAEVLAILSSGVDLPDVLVMDIEMPPTRRDEGLVTAREIRRRGIDVPILVLSSHLRESSAVALLQEDHQGIGFLSKDGAVDVDRLLDAVRRLQSGEPVVDDELVRLLLRRPRTQRRIDDLTPRERDVLARMAEGRSNRGIAEVMHLSERTVEGHVSNLLTKLDVDRSTSTHTRVGAVLAWLSARHHAPAG